MKRNWCECIISVWFLSLSYELRLPAVMLSWFILVCQVLKQALGYIPVLRSQSSQHVGGDRQQNKKLQQTVVGALSGGEIQDVLIIRIKMGTSYSLSKEETCSMTHNK